MTIEELIERLKALPVGAQSALVYWADDDGREHKVEYVDYESGRVVLS